MMMNIKITTLRDVVLYSLTDRYEHFKWTDASIFSVVEMVPIFWRNLLHSPFYLEDGGSSLQDPLEEGEKLESKASGNCNCKSKKWAFISAPLVALQDGLFVIPMPDLAHSPVPLL